MTKASGPSPWRIVGWTVLAAILLSVLSCVGIAALNSTALASVTVTATPGLEEPRDHNIPLVKQKEALPDYEVIVVRTNGREIKLGAKPDTLAVDGLTWYVPEPVGLSEIAYVQLREKDALLSDPITRTNLDSMSSTSDGYLFEFKTKRSITVGLFAFFTTPIGYAILFGILLAILAITLPIVLIAFRIMLENGF